MLLSSKVDHNKMRVHHEVGVVPAVPLLCVTDCMSKADPKAEGRTGWSKLRLGQGLRAAKPQQDRALIRSRQGRGRAEQAGQGQG